MGKRQEKQQHTPPGVSYDGPEQFTPRDSWDGNLTSHALRPLWERFCDAALADAAQNDGRRYRDAKERESDKRTGLQRAEDRQTSIRLAEAALNELNTIAFVQGGLGRFLEHHGMHTADLNDPAQKQRFNNTCKKLFRVCDVSSELTVPTGSQNARVLNRALSQALAMQFAMLRDQVIHGGADFTLQRGNVDYNVPIHKARQAFLHRPDVAVLRDMLWHVHADAIIGQVTNASKKIEGFEINPEDIYLLGNKILTGLLFNYDPTRWDLTSYLYRSLRKDKLLGQLISDARQRKSGISIHGRPNDKGEEFGIIHAQAAPPSDAPSRWDKERIIALVDQLPEDKADIARMRFGLPPYQRTHSIEVIAEHFGINVHAARKRLEGIRFKLKGINTETGNAINGESDDVEIQDVKTSENGAGTAHGNGTHVRPLNLMTGATFSYLLADVTEHDITEIAGNLMRGMKAVLPIAPSEYERSQCAQLLTTVQLLHEIRSGAYVPSDGLGFLLGRTMHQMELINELQQRSAFMALSENGHPGRR